LARKYFDWPYNFGKVFGSDERNNESFPVKQESSGYVVFIWDKIILVTEISPSTSEISVPGKTFSSHMNEM
jgi:hypothetical protein